jgi:hypothetical protein
VRLAVGLNQAGVKFGIRQEKTLRIKGGPTRPAWLTVSGHIAFRLATLPGKAGWRGRRPHL